MMDVMTVLVTLRRVALLAACWVAATTRSRVLELGAGSVRAIAASSAVVSRAWHVRASAPSRRRRGGDAGRWTARLTLEWTAAPGGERASAVIGPFQDAPAARRMPGVLMAQLQAPGVAPLDVSDHLYEARLVEGAPAMSAHALLSHVRAARRHLATGSWVVRVLRSDLSEGSVGPSDAADLLWRAAP